MLYAQGSKDWTRCRRKAQGSRSKRFRGKGESFPSTVNKTIRCFEEGERGKVRNQLWGDGRLASDASVDSSMFVRQIQVPSGLLVAQFLCGNLEPCGYFFDH